ncbi:MAG: MYG1 family protein [Candidatus Paceibacterota bacterium]
MIFFNKKKKSVAVHSGRFHADDVFSVAALSLYLNVDIEELEIKRTRDIEIIKKADYVFDVGFINDGETRFDHHQEGGAGTRDNGVPYASFGSMWKKFGEKICGDKKVSERIDKKIIESLDAEDNGVNITKCLFDNVSHFTLSDLIHDFNPTGKKDISNVDKIFVETVKFARNILEKEIKRTKNLIEEFEIAKDIIKKIYEETEDKRILVLEGDLPWKEIVNKFKEPLFVVVKNDSDKTWRVYTIRDDLNVFKNRKDLPESWAGKEKEELALISGVKDAMFCHIKRFLCSARTFDGAMEMAKFAVNN